MTQHKNIPDFVEVEFAMPFYEMYYPLLDYDCEIDPFELKELCNFLSIKLDTELLFNEYEKTKIEEGNIHIYFSEINKDIFIYFDLLKDKYDQMDMVIIGVRIKTDDLTKTREILHNLYFKSTTRSDIQEDYFNQSLWRVANERIPNNKRVVKRMNLK
ncbi:hypothetical protein [Cellulophaga baltica]|uniref:hypothetical protein n=1 Tax=Cellulophaga baltica TaxID=76594 RepID=UPI0024952970|nr:hypothetical protein [Cellulophaga baltica]